MALSLFLLRHGRTRLAGRFVGATDIDLSSDGVQQILEFRKTVRLDVFDKIYCSPMLRCRQTAELLGFGSSIHMDDTLKEIDFGRWEGMSYAEIEKQDSDVVADWIADPEGFCFPGGECLKHFLKRLESFKLRLQNDATNRALVITHGGIIRHLVCSYLDLPYRTSLVFQVREGLLTTLECFGDKGVLTGLNRKETEG